MQTTENPLRILHLEDDDNDHLLVGEMMREHEMKCEFTLAKSQEEFVEALKTRHFDLVISDFTIPSYNGMSALTLVREVHPEVPFIFFSGSIGEEIAVQSLTSGATDYVLKQRPKRLISAIQRALQNAAEHRHLQRAQSKIREQASLLDKASDAILVCDMKNRIVFWNKSAERIYGWTLAEVLGQSAVQVLFTKNPKLFDEAVMMVAQCGEWVGEMEHVAKGGRTIIVQSRFTLIRDDEGNPKSRLILNTDITEKKQLEAQFLRTQRLESLGVLISGIAHDLNNALAPILMGVGLLRFKSIPKDCDDILKTVETSAKRGSDMVKQVLTFARGGEMQKVLISMDQLVDELAQMIRDTFPKNIECRVEAQDCWPVLGSPTQIHQVLLNLCINARDAMPQGGVLTLTMKNRRIQPGEVLEPPDVEPGNYLSVSVADTGTGIPADQIKKIFEPFFTTKELGKGTGLGLSTSLGIIQGHGGFMQIESEVGRGTEFRFHLPAVSRVTGKSEKVPPVPHLPEGNGEGVLIINDEIGIAAIMKTALDNYGYQVLTAETGPEGILCLKENQETVSIVIVGLAMSLMDDDTLISTLQSVVPGIKILAVCNGEHGNGHHPPVPEECLIRKPFTTEKLIITVHQALKNELGKSA